MLKLRFWFHVIHVASDPPIQDSIRHLEEGSVHHMPLCPTPAVGLSADNSTIQDEERGPEPMERPHLWSKHQAGSSVPRITQFRFAFTTHSWRQLRLGYEQALGHWATDPRQHPLPSLQKAFTALQVGMSFLSPSTASFLNHPAEDWHTLSCLWGTDSSQGEGWRCFPCLEVN